MSENTFKDILGTLWKTLWISLALPFVLFSCVVILHQLNIRIVPPGNIRVWGILLFVLSVALGVALPVFFRTSFHSRYIKQGGVGILEYLSHQRNLIAVCSIAVISASIAYLFIVSPLYMYGSILAALYGIYSALPFKEKIVKELKIYKLEHPD